MAFPLQLQEISFQNESIHLFVPDPAAIKRAYQSGRISFPYWSQVWPSAKALALFLLRNTHFTKDQKVVELGAGLGLPSLIAARHASSVLCSDNSPEAVEVMRQSAARLQLQQFTANVMDWRQLPQELAADVLLLSDVNYEPAAFDTLITIVAAFLQKGTTILLSTPQRLIAKNFVAPLLHHCIHQEELAVWHERKDVLITVLVLQANQQ